MTSPEHKQMFEIVFTDQVMGRPFVVPPGVPADRVAALRAAFDATMKDATFLAEAKAAEDGDRSRSPASRSTPCWNASTPRRRR